MPNMEKGRGQAALLTNAAIPHGTGDCRACLGRDVPTLMRTHDNHGDLGPMCRYCIAQITTRGRRTVHGQCSFCGDTGRVRRSGKASACSYCVRSLRFMLDNTGRRVDLTPYLYGNAA